MRRLAARATCWAAAALLCVAFAASAASPESRYLQMPQERTIRPGAPVELLSLRLQVREPGWLYVQSDGVYAPAGQTIANAYISVDGKPVSNDSVTDWRGSRAPQPHAFNAIGAVRVQPGSVRVTLHGRSAGGAARFRAGSNLSAMLQPAREVIVSRLDRPSPWLDFDTRDTPEGTPLPGIGRKTVLAHRAGATGGAVVAMASGRSYAATSPGDAMWGIFLDGREPPIWRMTWSINDLFREGAESQASMFSQALFEVPRGGGAVALVASESPYYQPKMASTNAVKYRVGRSARLVTLSGGMRVVGSARTDPRHYKVGGVNSRFSYICLGTNGFNPKKCPPAGGHVVLGKARVCIPRGHNGVVLFSSKTRIQGDQHDPGGEVTLRLRIDGKYVGSTGYQSLGPLPHAVSTRTLSASYLAAGNAALKPGCHDVESVGFAKGDFRNISMNPDMPLLWFD